MSLNTIGSRLGGRLLARVQRAAADLVPDRMALCRRFEQTFGRPLDLRNPRTFNEKLFWLMLYYRPPIVTQLADKYEVRRYVAERIGPRFLTALYGVWDSVRDVDLAGLPDSFVLKVTSGWNMNILCPRKAGLVWDDATRARLTSWMSRTHYWHQREWCYKHITPRIIAEEYLTDPVWSAPSDYKFFCFGGEPRFIHVHTDRFGRHARDAFNLDWTRASFSYARPSSGLDLSAPRNLDEMIWAVRQLAEGFPFVRVDLYGVEGRSIFGEMTWYPSAGAARFIPESYALYWGNAIRLPARGARNMTTPLFTGLA